MFSEARQGAAARSGIVPAVRHTVFVSYSHAERDVQDLKDFRQYLDPLCEQLGFGAVWVDQTEIAPGDDWHREIEQGLDRASVFIVLLSQDYRSRSFCMQHELAPILNKARAGQARCIGIALHKLELGDFRAVDDADGSWLSMAKWQCLPQGMGDVDGRRRWGLVPMTQWPERRDAWYEVRRQLERELHQLAGPATQRTAVVPVGARHVLVADVAEHEAADEDALYRLPYLCDRSPQCDALWDPLAAWHEAGCAQPLVVVSTGAEADCLPEWVQRLAQHELPELLPAFGDGELVLPDPMDFEWPERVTSQADATRRLTLRWLKAHRLKVGATLADLMRVHADQVRPALWWTECRPAEDHEGAAFVSAGLADLLGRWPPLSPSTLLIVSISVLLDGARPGTVGADWLAPLQQAHGQGRLVLCCLDPMAPLMEKDMMSWSRSDKVKWHLHRRDVDSLSKAQRWPQPMREFAGHFHRWAGLAPGLSSPATTSEGVLP